jgi:predicted Zn-dependent protease
MKKLKNILMIGLGIFFSPSLVSAENISFSEIVQVQTTLKNKSNSPQILKNKASINPDGNFSEILNLQMSKVFTINCQAAVVNCSSLEISDYPFITTENWQQETEKKEPIPTTEQLLNSATDNQNRPSDQCLSQPEDPPKILLENSEQTEAEILEKPVTHVPQPTPEEIAIYKKIAQADIHYRCGETFLAEQLYREVKAPFPVEMNLDRRLIPEAIYEPAQLQPGGTVYWRLYQEGLTEQRFESKILAPLRLLTEQYPEFIPGHLHYAQALRETDHPDQAKKVLNNAVELYPNQAPLVIAKIEQDQAEKNWLDASLTARRFALFNPQHFRAPEFIQLADDNLERYRSDLNEQLALSALGNAILGGLGYAFLGNLNGPLSALETTILLMEGESSIGDRLANQLKNRLPLIEDPIVVAYVQEIGQKVAAVAGRNEFNYEFYVVMDEDINAFALPGGKVFINAGAILKTHSEAELAGLLAHEISHSALSHGFQLITQGNLTVNLGQFVPFVGYSAANLIVLNYSRDMERQADVFGTRILAASGYAADGVRGVMVILDDQSNPSPPAWLSTHPNTSDRVQYIEELIVQEGLNRYAYEGVARHWQIRNRVGQILDENNQNRQEF